MAGDYVMAIDQGTTGTTVMVFNHDSETVGQAYSEFTQHYPRPGWVEHDAAEIWDVSMQVMHEALDAKVADAVRIAIPQRQRGPGAALTGARATPQRDSLDELIDAAPEYADPDPLEP